MAIRSLVSFLLAAVTGAALHHRFPVVWTDPLLRVIELHSPTVHYILTRTYILFLYTTPFIATFALLSGTLRRRPSTSPRGIVAPSRSPGASHSPQRTPRLAPPEPNPCLRTTVYLDVPFERKEEVKALGARWNPELRSWCVPPRAHLAPFASHLPRWLHDLLFDPPAEAFLTLVPMSCWKCRTRAFSVALVYRHDRLPEHPGDYAWLSLDGHFSFITNGTLGQPFLTPYLVSLAETVADPALLATFRPRFSKTVGRTYLSQGCPRCNALWGDVPLAEDFSELDSDLVEKLLLSLAIALPTDDLGEVEK